MAHFAKIINGTVVDVIVLSDELCGGGNFPQSETVGQEFIREQLQLFGEWKQTSYNHNFRGRYACIGGTYDAVNDVFVAPTIEEEPA